VSQPAVAIRALHFDLKGLPPSAGRLVSILKLIAAAGYNALLVEWEDTFCWNVDPRFRSPTAYTREQVAAFCQEASRLGLEVIPLVQCLGHLEMVLSLPDYAHMREVPENNDTLNPLAKGAGALVAALVEDVISVLPNLRHFHLGGDEAWTFGTHPDTKSFIDSRGGGDAGKAALYLQHINPLLDLLAKRSLRPLLWHDMMVNWPKEDMHRLGQRADIVVWGYGGHPDRTEYHYNTKYIRRFVEAGVPLWAATAYKGGEGPDADISDNRARQYNALAWMELSQRLGPFKGVFATAWSRYSTDSLQTVPIDGSLDGLVNVGAIIRDGQAPGTAANLAILAATGEKAGWKACHDVCNKLWKARKNAWEHLKYIHQLLEFRERTNGARGGLHMAIRIGNMVKRQLDELDKIADKFRKAFAGRLEPIWIEEYLRTRIAPIRRQYEQIVQEIDSRR
jgi:hexosaminidase